ncbi:LiaI-LiaF-like domain-containing protein [Virgibacillus byunsanensis]|uniref:LiaI-LiaF-like domain-containing protein n=1 Tax=Virgibacillus byunsanensis TaxID=570945 RepID=A0ABW3LMG7_9BACI
MKKQNTFAAYILIGIGIYFLLRELRIPIITDFYSWPTLLIIIGLAILIYSYSAKDYQHLFSGTIVLGIGIHFHGLNHYAFWIDHWAVYILIIGIAFFIRYLRTKQGLLPSVILVVISLMMIFSLQLPAWFSWIYVVFDYLDSFWPIILIGVGLYLLKKKR